MNTPRNSDERPRGPSESGQTLSHPSGAWEYGAHDGAHQVKNAASTAPFAGGISATRDVGAPAEGAVHAPGPSETRFLREAYITARLEHPGIVPVHDAGRWPDGTPFYAMKLVAGRSLSALLLEAGTADQRLALLPHLMAVADAIACAHDRDIIHRDLKPSNIIIGEFGETIVIDWGLAKELTDGEDLPMDGPYRQTVTRDLTAIGAVLGTPEYMSPEQEDGRPVDATTDIYALGVMLFQLCTGRLPAGPADVLDRTGLRRSIPKDLAAITNKCLERAPGDRYANASRLAADLRAYYNRARVAARTYSFVDRIVHCCPPPRRRPPRRSREPRRASRASGRGTIVAMPPIVRVAGSRDLDVLLPLVEQFQACERIPFDPAAARQPLARLLEEPNLGQVLLAESDGTAIGYAVLTYGYDLEFGGRDAYLTDLFLVEVERDRGLGSWLLGEVEESAREAGVQALHLMVAPSNQRAHHVYHRAGFRASPRLFLTKLLTE